MIVDPPTISRFVADLAALAAPGARLGLAVSGGPDSLALLLLAHAAIPGRFAVATVDHGLRDEAAAEAEAVAALCASLGIAHATLAAEWAQSPTVAIQARARDERYRLLARWARASGLAAVLTAHHADDQAETLLMRLARGAGVNGLAAARASRELDSGVMLLRPLLSWRRSELASIVAAAGIEPADDPSNRDPAFERIRARAFLAGRDWPDPLQLAASARHLADAAEALDHAESAMLDGRMTEEGGGYDINPAGLPREWRRRLLVGLFLQRGIKPPRGPDLDRARATLAAGGTCTLAGYKLVGGSRWRATPVPPRAG